MYLRPCFLPNFIILGQDEEYAADLKVANFKLDFFTARRDLQTWIFGINFNLILAHVPDKKRFERETDNDVTL